MIAQIGGFEDVIEKGQTTVKNAAKSAVQGVSNFASTTASQITNSDPTSSTQADHGTNEAGSSTQQQMSDDDAKKFLQDLYGVKTAQNTASQGQASQQQAAGGKKTAQNQQSVKAALGLVGSKKPHENAVSSSDVIKTALGLNISKEKIPQKPANQAVKDALGIPVVNNKEKTPEELAKIESLRKELHGAYYQNLINPRRAPDESVSEKLEREDQEKKLADLETQKEKPPPLPATVKQGTGESVVGVSG